MQWLDMVRRTRVVLGQISTNAEQQDLLVLSPALKNSKVVTMIAESIVSKEITGI
jgi:hypothetical protein